MTPLMELKYTQGFERKSNDRRYQDNRGREYEQWLHFY